MGDHSHSLATVLCKSTKLPTYHPNPNSSRKSAILGHRYDSVDNLVQDFDMSCARLSRVVVWVECVVHDDAVRVRAIRGLLGAYSGMSRSLHWPQSASQNSCAFVQKNMSYHYLTKARK